MNDLSEAFRQYVKSRRGDPTPGEHLSDDALIAFAQGRLPEAEQARRRAHVLQCDDCKAAFRLVHDFFAPAKEGEPTLSAAEVERRWRTLRRRWRREAAGRPVREAGLLPRGRGLWWGWPAAMIASLVGLLLSGGWFWTWQRGRTWQRQAAAQEQATRQELARVQEENQRLRAEREQVNRTRVQLSQRLQQLTTPQVNLPIALVYPSGGTRRLASGPVLTVTRPPLGTPLALILYSDSPARYVDYHLAVLDAAERVVWSADGLQRQAALGGYTLLLPAEPWPPGLYHLQVYGERDGRRTPVDSYRIRLVAGP